MTAEKPTGRKRRLILVAMAIGAVLVGAQAPKRLFIAKTPSVKSRLLWLSGDPLNARHGDYVVFTLDRDRLQGIKIPKKLDTDPSKPLKVVKRLACDEGEVLKHSGAGGRDFYCGEEFVGRAKQVSRTGVPLQPTDFEGTIPQGKAFMAGDDKDAYDSRYFGLVDKRDFLYRATGIF